MWFASSFSKIYHVRLGPVRPAAHQFGDAQCQFGCRRWAWLVNCQFHSSWPSETFLNYLNSFRKFEAVFFLQNSWSFVKIKNRLKGIESGEQEIDKSKLQELAYQRKGSSLLKSDGIDAMRQQTRTRAGSMSLWSSKSWIIDLTNE